MLKSQNNDDRKKKKTYEVTTNSFLQEKGIKMSREEQTKMSHNRKEAYGTVY